jgi:hypothetical protein
MRAVRNVIYWLLAQEVSMRAHLHSWTVYKNKYLHETNEQRKLYVNVTRYLQIEPSEEGFCDKG